MTYDNTNTGVLFKNDRKETERHPDYTGTLNVEGTDRYFSAWLKTSKSGTKFLSLSLGKPKASTQSVNQSTQAVNSAADDFEQDIPFN